MTRHSSGKGSRATTGGGSPLPSLPASTITPPLSKLAMPMPERAAARQQRRVAVDIERQAVQRAQRRRDRQRDLRAGAEAGMARDRLLDHQPMMAAHAEMPAERRRDARAARSPSGPSTKVSRGSRQRHDGFGLAQRQAEAAEAPPGAAVEVEEAEMQAGGHSYGNGIRHLPPMGASCMHHGSLGARGHDSRFPSMEQARRPCMASI